MGKITGFLEIPRQDADHESPAERVRHWREFRTPWRIDHLRQQAARCMNCGVPFCHSGFALPTGTSGCPVYNLIPDWNDKLYRGQWEEAVQLLLATNNFPEFTGRVCPAPCEGACVLGINQEPVTIKNHEYAIIEYAFSKGWIKPRPPARRTGCRVAVVGSGPAGLAAADELNRMGHSVVVYERADRPGGLLMYGIPNMKLDKQKVLMRRIRIMEQEGVVFKTGVEVGSGIPVKLLQEQYQAIIMCTGATVPRDLPVPGRHFKGIMFAMEYLEGATRAYLDNLPAPDARGKRVVVIGGGDTGTDCVATAIRQNCCSVTQLEIMPPPPPTRAPDNPWPEYPRVFHIDYGHQEAEAVLGKDPRQYEILTRSFTGNGNGRVTGVVTVRVNWRHQGGKLTMTEIPGTEQVIPADLVLLALGFTGTESLLAKQLGLQLDNRNNIKAAYGCFATAVPGVFAAGDCRRGQSLVVWAINEGRGAARACNRYLQATGLP